MMLARVAFRHLQERRSLQARVEVCALVVERDRGHHRFVSRKRVVFLTLACPELFSVGQKGPLDLKR